MSTDSWRHWQGRNALSWASHDDSFPGPVRCGHPRRRRGGLDVRRSRGPARAARAADRPCRPAREEDPDLRGRALQLHEPRRGAGAVPLGQSAFRQVGAGPLPAGGLHRPGRPPPDRLAREDAGPALLRRLRPADRAHADGGMREGVGADLARQGDRRREPCRRDVHRPLRRRGGQRAFPRHRHRRPLHPEDGRDRLRLRACPALRSRDRGAAAGFGAAHARR